MVLVAPRGRCSPNPSYKHKAPPYAKELCRLQTWYVGHNVVEYPEAVTLTSPLACCFGSILLSSDASRAQHLHVAAPQGLIRNSMMCLRLKGLGPGVCFVTVRVTIRLIIGFGA